MFNIGKRVQELRKSRNIKSVVLAHDCDFSQGFLSSIENNQKKCSIENLEKICNALNITLSEFFSTEPSKITSQEYLLLDSVRKLNSKQLELLTAFIRSIGEIHD